MSLKVRKESGYKIVSVKRKWSNVDPLEQPQVHERRARVYCRRSSVATTTCAVSAASRTPAPVPGRVKRSRVPGKPWFTAFRTTGAHTLGDRVALGLPPIDTHIVFDPRSQDHMTMGASIECREPFLDFRLVERLAALPSSVLLGGARGKRLREEAVGSRLPAEVRRYRKWGFRVPCVHYFRTIPALQERIRDLPRTRPVSHGPFEKAGVGRVTREFLAGDNRWLPPVRQLFMVAAWHKALIQTPQPAETL